MSVHGFKFASMSAALVKLGLANHTLPRFKNTLSAFRLFKKSELAKVQTSKVQLVKIANVTAAVAGLYMPM